EQLREENVRADQLGFRHTTYQQVLNGVRVFSGVLRVHQDASGGVMSANGRFYTNLQKVDTVPTLSAEAAMDYAAAAMPGVNQAQGPAELVVVDPGWYGDPPTGARLCYYCVLTAQSGLDVRAFFVDATTGEIVDQWSKVCTLRDREIYNGNGFEYPGTLVRAEGDPPASGHPDVNPAYDYYGDVYDYYARAFGRDSIDNHGMTMVGIVNSQFPNCPNAFWLGDPINAMFFCPGLVVDDVLAHELTHGVTENSANLIYQNQPGQLNEAFSDIFGELVDLFNGNAAFLNDASGTQWPTHPTGSGTDAPNQRRTACSNSSNNYADGVRWLMGEDATATGGAIRDMWSPQCFGDPENANTLYQRCHVFDEGGVHSGSSVLLHAFAMATDGTTYNGYTINGIGPIKTGAVFYRALTTYLIEVSDFQDAYSLLNRAAQDLIGTTPKDPRTGLPSASVFTASDAQEINKALLAVELNTPGRCGMQPLLDAGDAPVCGDRSVIYADDFESGVQGWQTENTTVLSSSHAWKQVSGLQDGRVGHAWYVSDPSVSCAGSGAAGIRRLLSPTIALPQEVHFPTLMFTQLVQTESYWDGGIVSIRVNGGAWKRVPRASFLFNPYNLPLYSGTDNPLTGEWAFSGWGGQWGTSLIDLRDFATGGDEIQVRFDFGTDYCEGFVGWYIDDFEVYDCVNGSDCNENGVPDTVEIDNGPQAALLLDQPQTYSGLVALGTGQSAPYDTLNAALAYAENFYLPQPASIGSLRLWGGYASADPGGDDFQVLVHKATPSGLPGSLVSNRVYDVAASWTPTGIIHSGVTIWQIDLSIAPPVELGPGDYFVEIHRSTAVHGDFYWEIGNYAPDTAWYAYSNAAPGRTWYRTDDPNNSLYPVNLGLEVRTTIRGADCNTNGIPDDCDVASGLETDCNANGILDSCESPNDCNSNGIYDICENDCNHNALADECDIAAGTSTDCNANDKPDECEFDTDCNGNGVGDMCDVMRDGAPDCDNNLMPDSCQPDRDSDGHIDACDACPDDPNKSAKGRCGCGKPETDSDHDTVPDCVDQCANGDDRIDTDKDGTPDCADECPNDKDQVKAGQCGCGVPEHDPDGDGVASCVDNCPMNANPDQRDVDSDGLGDMCDGCPTDPEKSAPGLCGCGLADVDSDNDGLYDCADPCPNDPTPNNTDSDEDGVGDACDGCPFDANKTEPGVCGCGVSDSDADADGVPDCIDACPGTLAGTEVDDVGCPANATPPPQPTPAPDTDGDGVTDDIDQCPNTAITVAVDAVGCPVTATPSPSINDPACGSIGVVGVILLGLGLVGIRQRMR
ncbi:MAG TPA: M4 family metallopeptidase, partial [Phycisphaerae bacterium]|nr:M4 family metallopeptidase [Phycisphaerae bacterium]